MKAEIKKRDAGRSKAAIIHAARQLFAERGIAKASIRDIAKAAGVSHGLVQQYFGTRKRLIAAIIRSEIEDFGKQIPPSGAGEPDHALDDFRRLLETGMARFRDYALIITRAELAGVKPEKLLDPAVPTPAVLLAALISKLQAKAPTARKRMDPRLVSAYINASLFAFATMSPWLMTSVGLKPEDYEARLDEIVDICVQLVALAGGTTDGKP
ncbi:MAG: TetR/AcrR family transcriptional regulator [bacterium]